ncbi:hypothetical protein MBLNU457_g2414t1 [Dothideomycetes sp. NU457]
MAETEVASVVAPPSPSRSPTADRGTKRPAQHEEDNDRASASPKRQRIASSDTAKPTESHEASTSPKRTRPSLDERKRNKRLFGNLLSTLSQKPGTSTTQRRREEIDSRKRDELAARAAELEARSEERAARTLALRKRCQRKVEERALRVRHEGMRAMAGCLRTEAEPRLFWRPWEWRPEEEARVLRQKEDVEVEIQREEEEFEERMKRRALEDADGREDGADAVMSESAEKATNENGHGSDDRKEEEVIVMTAADGGEEGQVHRQNEETNAVPDQQAQTEEAQRRSSVDEAGDAMVDAGEDTLMY